MFADISEVLSASTVIAISNLFVVLVKKAASTSETSVNVCQTT
jgi:hypothetical protein